MIKYLNIKDKKKRNNFLITENEKLRLKSIIYNRMLSKQVRILYSYKLTSFSKSNSIVQIKNRCLISNRGQAIYRIFHLSRITLKEFISLNKLAGIRKSSW
jgi:ribosomal protein S14